ncbi:MAG TPA: diaminopimelate decarboxylase [Acidimicrobiia bacterium]|nr:diaminopimelate decarboxylase [Acidimicrobiia bacterium]
MTAPFDLSLLPRSSRVDDRGRLSIGDCDLEELADEFGTPLVVYDEGELRARAREYHEWFPGGAAYASKAFLCTAMARLVHEEGLHLDVATGGELHVALRAGFPVERIVFHGNNKSDDELRRALVVGVGRIAVDSFDEIDRIERLVADGAPAPAVHVRVTPGVEAHTHEFIETGTEDSKFGFSLERGAALSAACRVVASPAMRFAGIHCHIGSQVFRLDSFERAVDRMVELIGAIEREASVVVDEINLGGGLGVRYLSTDVAPSIAEYARGVHDAVRDALARARVASTPRLMTEPGRSIAGPAGLTLYRVGTIKEIPGVRTYVAVDGGMSDNLRPVTYGARYEAFVPARATAPRDLVATVAGKHCEQGDLLVRDAHLPTDLVVGDVIATPGTGAYGVAMASNYNKVTRPAVVFVHGGIARVVVRRETLDDLLSHDVDA